MRQYVRLFEYGIADYTQDQARDLSVNLFGRAEMNRIFDTHRYPSQEIGEMLDLPIWREWRMPFGWNENKTARIYETNYRAFHVAREAHAKNTYLERILKIGDELVSLNPDLREIPEYDKYMFDVVIGAVSRFNLDDMKFYMSFRKRNLLPYQTAMSDTEYSDTIKQIERMLQEFNSRTEMSYDARKSRLGWVPSPETLRQIHDRLTEILK